MKFFFSRMQLLTLSLIALTAVSQPKSTITSLPSSKPKLVIGMVVDQMRYDFLYRYSEKYGTGGFKRLLREGYSCENTHINYSPSYTACGHTCVYTGAVPSVHGITGNDWYDLEEGRSVYCTEDSTMNTVGSASKAGKMSPHRMLVTTVGDQLRLANNYQSKTIGIALKDRGAILPAGHSANAAYFFDGTAGGWITSSYYMSDLPAWAKAFNDKKLADKYVSQNWKTLLPLAQYLESHDDDQEFESPYKNETKPVFEHKVSELKTPSLDIIKATPYGNSLTLDFAKAAIEGEQLGKGKYTDFLAVSLSSTDYIGHQFGPNSVEVEDCYLRLDKDLSSFFNYLDITLGKGSYVLFLTADHGAAHVPAFMKEKKIPAGVFPMDTVLKQLGAKLKNQYGEGEWILDYANMQLYINNRLLAEKKADRVAFKKTITDFLLGFDGIANVLDMENLCNENIDAGFKSAILNSHYPKRSGELYVLQEPGWFEGMAKGTTHGTVYPYDTHIPLVWMGWNIKHSEDHHDIHMTDIAPTIAAMLHIQEPDGCVGKVIEGIFAK